MTTAQYNKHYVAYAASEGRTPREQLVHDEEQYPDGKMIGFIIWIHNARGRWAAETGETRELWSDSWSDHQRAAFDAWLERRTENGD